MLLEGISQWALCTLTTGILVSRTTTNPEDQHYEVHILVVETGSSCEVKLSQAAMFEITVVRKSMLSSSELNKMSLIF